MKYIGLTGASGLLGKHVIFLLLKKNYKVVATSRKKPSITHKNLIWKKMDLSKKIEDSKLRKIFEKAICLVHIGALVPVQGQKKNLNLINKTNVVSSLKLANWSKQNNKHFIFISGSVLYKHQDFKNNENSTILRNSRNSYINSKIVSERKLLTLNKGKFKITILRVSSLYGFGMNKKRLIPNLLKKISNGKNITIYNNDQTEVNFVHAKDVSEAILKCIKYRKFGIFNIAGKKTLSFLKIASIIKREKRSKSKIFLKKNNSYQNLNRLDVSIKKSKKILNWLPKIEFKQGLEMIIKKRCI